MRWGAREEEGGLGREGGRSRTALDLIRGAEATDSTRLEGGAKTVAVVGVGSLGLEECTREDCVGVGGQQVTSRTRLKATTGGFGAGAGEDPFEGPWRASRLTSSSTWGERGGSRGRRKHEARFWQSAQVSFVPLLPVKFELNMATGEFTTLAA